jgi:hypothetical protein
MSIADTVKIYVPQHLEEGITDVMIASFVGASIAVFSRHVPRLLISKETVASTNTSYALTLPADWEAGFSTLVGIEYPLANNPPTYLELDDYQMYLDPNTGSNKILFIGEYPVEDFAITFTGLWTETTLNSYDKDSVALLASSMVCDRLSAKYAGGTDDIIQADVINWRTKTRDYTDAKKNFLQLFCLRTGVGEKNMAPVASLSYSTMILDSSYVDSNF